LNDQTSGAELTLGMVPSITPASGTQVLGPAEGLIELDRATDMGDNHAAILDNRYVAYDQVPLSNSTGWNGDAAIRGYDMGSGQAVTLVPGLDAAGGDNRMPAWSADGRYLAYIQHSDTDQTDNLYVYDFDTGQYVNPTPIDLGVDPSDTDVGVFRRLEGNLSIADDPTLTREAVAVVTSTLVCHYDRVTTTIVVKRPTGGVPIIINRVTYVQKCTLQAGLQVTGSVVTVGFLVQRIVGQHRVLGRLQYELKPVGRLPLGPHRGRFKVRRAFQFGSKGLPPGRYLITGRTLAGPNDRVAGLSTPRVVVVSAPK
jgi:WD40 repeat protein